MIKAAATDKETGDPVIILGLSAENIRRLQDDQPIRVDLSEMGLTGQVVIFAGETEEAMTKTMMPLIGPKTRISRD